jgi:hypothetical protein
MFKIEEGTADEEGRVPGYLRNEHTTISIEPIPTDAWLAEVRKQSGSRRSYPDNTAYTIIVTPHANSEHLAASVTRFYRRGGKATTTIPHTTEGDGYYGCADHPMTNDLAAIWDEPLESTDLNYIKGR